MQILHGLGDIPLRRAYTLIKAISKKNRTLIDSERSKFIEGAQAKGVTPKKAEGLFNLILKFAGYGFNKSHSTGYAIIAYQTAHLKTYYPNQYMAALLTYESAARKVEDWVPYLDDCAQTVFPDHTEDQPHVGVVVKPPDVNLSEASFSVVFMPDEPRDACHGHVRFGLNAIRGVSSSAIGAIIAQRNERGPFTSIFDFCERVDLRAVNKATIEALVKSGAFDSVHGIELRAAVLAAIADAINAGQSAAEDRRAGQMNFFATPEGQAKKETARPLPAVPPWDRNTTLAFEKETLGFHVSGHPLDEHELRLRDFCTCTVKAAASLANKTVVKLGGVLGQVRPRVVRNGRSAGQKMALLSIADKTGSMDAVIFTEPYAKFAGLISNDAIVVVVGRVDHARGEPNVVIDQVIPIEAIDQHIASRLELDLFEDPGGESAERLMQLIEQTLRHARAEGGRALEVRLNLHDGGRRIALRPHRRIVPEVQLLDRLREMLGPDRVRLTNGAS